MQNHSNENEFDLHENGHAGETHFHMNGFEQRLVLKVRHRVTWEWPISWTLELLRVELLRFKYNFGCIYGWNPIATILNC